MRILYLAHRVPDAPNKGDKIRSYHQLRALAAQHEVHLFALDDDPRNTDPDPAWRTEVATATVLPLARTAARWRVATALASGGSLSAAHFAVPALRARLRSALRDQRFDAAVVYSGAMDPLLEGFRPRVLDLVDVDSAKFQAYCSQRAVSGLKRLAFGVEGRRLQSLEQSSVEDADVSLVCTQAEAEVLRTFARPRRLEVLTNGVDTERFAVGDFAGRDPQHIVFIGALDYQANVDAACHLATDLLPRIHQSMPQVKLTIVGRHPTAEVLALGQRAGVTVVDNAPDVVPYLHQATCTVLPFRIARGIQNKALEAFATGLPVILSRLTAQGLEGEAGRHYRAGDSDAEIVEQTLQVLRQPTLQQELAGAGRQLVQSCYSWHQLLKRFVELVEEVAIRPVAQPAGAGR